MFGSVLLFLVIISFATAGEETKDSKNSKETTKKQTEQRIVQKGRRNPADREKEELHLKGEFQKKFDELVEKDTLFSGDDEKVKKTLVKYYIRYRASTVKTYVRAKSFRPLTAIQTIQNLGLPLDAEYVDGHFDGEEMQVVKVHVGTTIKKYKPESVKLYADDVARAIDKEIQAINNERLEIKKGAYPKKKMIDYLNKVRFERFHRKYWKKFLRNQKTVMKMPKL